MTSQPAKLAFIDEEMRSRRDSGRLRSLRNVRPAPGGLLNVGGRELINFCSNDYLGLSRHPLLQERSLAFMRVYGAGSTASRLVCGNLEAFEIVEKRLARLKGTEDALIFPSGYQANVSLLPALTDRESLILSDRLNHNSIINGCRLSRCKVVLFNHNDLGHLERLIEEHRPKGYSRILIVTESVFSMDGDRSDIPALSKLASRFEALLVLDEAHATGGDGPKRHGTGPRRPGRSFHGYFQQGGRLFRGVRGLFPPDERIPGQLLRRPDLYHRGAARGAGGHGCGPGIDPRHDRRAGTAGGNGVKP